MTVIRHLLGAALLGFCSGSALIYALWLSEFGLSSILVVLIGMVLVLLVLVPMAAAALEDFVRGRWCRPSVMLIGMVMFSLAISIGKAASIDVRFAVARAHYLNDLELDANPTTKTWAVVEDLYGVNGTYLIYHRPIYHRSGEVPPTEQRDGCSVHTQRVDDFFYLEIYRC